MNLSPDPETALWQIAIYLRTARIEPGRAVFDPQDAGNEPQGYWQAPEWLDGLLEIADAIDQRATPSSDERSTVDLTQAEQP